MSFGISLSAGGDVGRGKVAYIWNSPDAVKAGPTLGGGDGGGVVAEYRLQVYGNSIWAPVFVRDGFDDDESLVNFFNKLNEAKVGESSVDRVRWDLTTQGCFTVRSFYLKLLDGKFSPQEVHSENGFPCKFIWKSLAPVKVSFFVWEATHGNILTCHNLQKWGKVLVNRCFMCKRLSLIHI